jgi:hypothetical protein
MSDNESPVWEIKLTGWRAILLGYFTTFAIVLGFLWMFLSVQQSLARIFGGGCQ